MRAIIAERAVHAAFDVMHRAGIHQLDDRLVTGKRCAGEPHQVAAPMRAAVCRAVKSDAVAVAQVMMAADGHAVAQAAESQRSFQVATRLSPLAG